MKVNFEEKTYESYFNNELDSKSSVYFPPGQVLEGLLGFDATANSKNRALWRCVGHPYWFRPRYSGVDLRDIAQELEVEFKRIPRIKTNLLFQYKRPCYITKANGKEWKHWDKEYYRYQLSDDQHKLLSKIDKAFGDMALVLYASPAINNLDALVECKLQNKIIESSNFTKASALNNHSKNTYINSGTFSIACSEPEKLESIKLLSQLEAINMVSELNCDNNKSFLIDTKNIITDHMAHSKPFQRLMNEYKDLQGDSIIYTFLTMKVFREITGVQWVLSIEG